MDVGSSESIPVYKAACPLVSAAYAARTALRYNTPPFPITRLLQPSEFCEVTQKHTKDLISKSAKQRPKNEQLYTLHCIAFYKNSF
jgi:hypothetical protein